MGESLVTQNSTSIQFYDSTGLLENKLSVVKYLDITIVKFDDRYTKTYKIKHGLGVELRYSYGFEDLVDVTYTDLLGNEISKDRIGSNRVFQLGVFYKFSKK